jgi:hypothetical protein
MLDGQIAGCVNRGERHTQFARLNALMQIKTASLLVRAAVEPAKMK